MPKLCFVLCFVGFVYLKRAEGNNKNKEEEIIQQNKYDTKNIRERVRMCEGMNKTIKKINDNKINTKMLFIGRSDKGNWNSR